MGHLVPPPSTLFTPDDSRYDPLLGRPRHLKPTFNARAEVFRPNLGVLTPSEQNANVGDSLASGEQPSPGLPECPTV